MDMCSVRGMGVAESVSTSTCLADILDRLLVRHAEALLLVDNEQAQILELASSLPSSRCVPTIRSISPVSSFRMISASVPAACGNALSISQRTGKPSKRRLHGVIMLLREHRRRHKNGRLLAVGHAFERGAQRHLGLAVPHVAAQQAVHRGRRFHVLLDILDRLQLVGRFLEGEIILELALPCAVRAEGVALLILAFGVEFDQIERPFS